MEEFWLCCVIAFLREDYLSQVQGFDLSRASELTRSTPSCVPFGTGANVQHSSIWLFKSRKVERMTHTLRLELIDSAAHPLLPAIRELLRDYQRSLGIDLCFQDFENELLDLPGAYGPPDGRLYAAFVGEQLAGSLALRRHDAQSGEMKRLYLRPEFLGQGFGKRMTERIIQDARQIGYQSILLDTLPSMQAAQSLYEKLGFRETEAYVFNPVAGVRYMALAL
jgi:ribosomal protein S18 acetylase RimI-like enzyme